MDEERRLDLLVTVGAQRWALDVSIVNPAARSYAGDGPGGACERAEREKKDKYGLAAQRRGMLLRPFVLDCFGHFGAEARQFLRDVSSRLSSTYGHHRNRVYTRLVNVSAVAVQRGNAVCKLTAAAYADGVIAGNLGRRHWRSGAAQRQQAD